jgi:hypothetical protein
MGGTSEDLVRQIFQARKMKSDGIILFDYAHTTPVYTSTLMAGAFNEKGSVQAKKGYSKKKVVQKEKIKQEDKSKRKTIITTSSSGSWIFTK